MTHSKKIFSKLFKKSFLLIILATLAQLSPNSAIKAFFWKKPQNNYNNYNAVYAIGGAAVVTIVALKVVNVVEKYKIAKEQERLEKERIAKEEKELRITNIAKEELQVLNMLKNDPYYSYEELKHGALNLYLDQENAAERSIESEYAIIWLEANARKNAKFLQNTDKLELRELGKSLQYATQNLRRHELFIQDLLAYNEKYRAQEYKEEKLANQRRLVTLQKQQVEKQEKQLENQKELLYNQEKLLYSQRQRLANLQQLLQELLDNQEAQLTFLRNLDWKIPSQLYYVYPQNYHLPQV